MCTLAFIMGWRVFPQNDYVKVLTPQYLRVLLPDLEIVSLQMSFVNMKSHWVPNLI